MNGTDWSDLNWNGTDPLASDLNPLASDLNPLASERTALRSRRVELDPDNVERGLAQLVLTVVELLRELMERQALRRIDVGDLTDEQIERLGSTLMLLEERMGELKETFGFTDDDLNIDLGPLGTLR